MSNSSQNIFDQAGIQDPLLGVKIFELLGIDNDSFVTPQNAGKIKAVIRFAQSSPDALRLLERAIFKTAYRPGEDKLDAAIRFIDLRARHSEASEGIEKMREEMESREKELSFVESEIKAYE